MQRQPTDRAARGFTLIETLVVLIIILTVALFTMPSVLATVRQGKLRGMANQTAVLMRLARLEAIRYGCPAVVRMAAAGGGQPAGVEGFADCNGDGLKDADKRSLGRFPMPRNVRLLAPPALEGKDAVADLSVDPTDPVGPKVAIFQADGSVRATGAFRFGDISGNFLEVRVDPAATARIEVRKCKACTNADDLSDWYAAGDGGGAWTWK
jgi:prepilin-type N-terminal cleavage/methylation domain-containing protein